jgi:general secretion pathway protein F
MTASSPAGWRALFRRAGPAAPRGRRLTPARRAALIRQLATLTVVMPVSDAVATLARQPDDTPERDVLRQTNRALQAGHPLAAALPPAAFPPELRATIAAGEASGRLALLLSRLADMLEAQLALRGRLVAALAYPVLLVVVALGVIAAMLVFVVPAIAEQLLAGGATLPFVTRAVLWVSDALRHWGWLLLAMAVAAGLAAWFLLRRPDVRARADRGLLGLWGVGGWLSALEAVRWARMLATMLGSGLPLAEALVLTGPTLANTAWREASARIAADVRSGRSLAATLGLLPRPPALLVALARTGEASGRLAPLLESAAQSLDRQLSDRSRTLIALAEPLIIVTLGGIVGLIILAVLLPILQLNTLAAGGPGGP